MRRLLLPSAALLLVGSVTAVLLLERGGFSRGTPPTAQLGGEVAGLNGGVGTSLGNGETDVRCCAANTGTCYVPALGGCMSGDTSYPSMNACSQVCTPQCRHEAESCTQPGGQSNCCLGLECVTGNVCKYPQSSAPASSAAAPSSAANASSGGGTASSDAGAASSAGPAGQVWCCTSPGSRCSIVPYTGSCPFGAPHDPPLQVECDDACLALGVSSAASSDAWTDCPAAFSCTYTLLNGQCFPMSFPACAGTVETNGTCGSVQCPGNCIRCVLPHPNSSAGTQASSGASSRSSSRSASTGSARSASARSSSHSTAACRPFGSPYGPCDKCSDGTPETWSFTGSGFGGCLSEFNRDFTLNPSGNNTDSCNWHSGNGPGYYAALSIVPNNGQLQFQLQLLDNTTSPGLVYYFFDPPPGATAQCLATITLTRNPLGIFACPSNDGVAPETIELTPAGSVSSLPACSSARGGTSSHRSAGGGSSSSRSAGASSAQASRAAACGNGRREGKEECDDGNGKSGDCCSSSCTIEPACSCRLRP